ncbi:hypothetical protein IT40_26445 [Paracoccus versutus]|nr:hypothetical protein IT40_26445 [Paracoccus versutus]
MEKRHICNFSDLEVESLVQVERCLGFSVGNCLIVLLSKQLQCFDIVRARLQGAFSCCQSFNSQTDLEEFIITLRFQDRNANLSRGSKNQGLILDESKHRIPHGRHACPQAAGQFSNSKARIRRKAALHQRIGQLRIDNLPKIFSWNRLEIKFCFYAHALVQSCMMHLR